MKANEYFDFATPTVLDHKASANLNSETFLYNYPWLDQTTNMRALAGVVDQSVSADTRYFVDLKLTAKTSSFPSRMKFTFFLVTSISFQTNRFTESPKVSEVLEVEAFLNCSNNCSACVLNPTGSLMTCQACFEGFTLDSGRCV